MAGRGAKSVNVIASLVVIGVIGIGALWWLGGDEDEDLLE